MKTTLFLALLFHFYLILPLCAQQPYTQVYGTVQTDINRGYKIIALPNNTFVIGGEWNGKAYLMKVAANGNQLRYRSLDTQINGNSTIKDMLLDADGSIVAVGECTRCANVTTDSLKKAFAIRTDTALTVLKTRVYNGANAANNILSAPSIARKGSNLIMIASTGGLGLNFEDLVLQSLNTNLDTVWRKVINSCSNCGFEYAYGIAPTSTGVTALIGHAFTDSITTYHFDLNGNILWKTRAFTFEGLDNATIAANGNGKIYIAGGAKGVAGFDPTKFTAIISTLSEATGVSLTGTVINTDTLTDETIRTLSVTTDGSILVGYSRTLSTSVASRVYRLNASDSQIASFTDIPNPDAITSMTVTSVVPMNNNGTQYAACGIRGLFNRTFFHSYTTVRVSTEESDLENDFTVYPNPTTSNITVKIPKTNTPVSLVLSNVLGQVLWKQTIKHSLVNEERYFTIAEKGFYFLQLQSEKKATVRKIRVE